MVIDESPSTCVVIGGRGFLGRSLVLRLLKLGKWIVRIADSYPSLDLDPTELNSILSESISNCRASYFHVDYNNESHIVRAIEGSSVVFYTDVSDSNAHDFCLCYKSIVQGVKNVINACRDCKVKRLIYKSSADVLFDGSHDIFNGDESLPYPCKFQDIVNDLKVQAEAMVLFANNNDGLLTCVLRPSNTYGPGDTQLVPVLVNWAKSIWAKSILGSSETVCDFTYVENVAHALICAEEALVSQLASVAGKAFFISNLEPMKFWDFASLILDGLGYQGPIVKFPAGIVRLILFLIKWMYDNIEIKNHGYMASTRYIIQLALRSCTFNCSAAQKLIGYSPVVSMKEGVTLTIEAFSHVADHGSLKRFSDSREQSKVDQLLGSGKVADILLWRDEKKTFTYFLATVLLVYWFLLSGRTFISSAAKLLLLIIVVLFGNSIFPSNIYGYSIQKIPSSYLEISEKVIQDSIGSAAYMCNRGIDVIRSLAHGEDWNIFFKVAFSLYLLKVGFSYSFTLVVGVVVVFAFTSFFVYEQCEEEIEGLAKALVNGLKELKGFIMRNLPESVASLISNLELLFREERPDASKDLPSGPQDL